MIRNIYNKMTQRKRKGRLSNALTDKGTTYAIELRTPSFTVLLSNKLEQNNGTKDDKKIMSKAN